MIVDIEDGNARGPAIEQRLRRHRGIVHIAVAARKVGRGMVAGWPAQRESRTAACLYMGGRRQRHVHGGADRRPGSGHEGHTDIEGVAGQHRVHRGIGHLVHAAHAEHIGRGEAASPELRLPQRPAALEEINESRRVNAQHGRNVEMRRQHDVAVSLVPECCKDRVHAIRALAHRNHLVVAHFLGAGMSAMIVRMKNAHRSSWSLQSRYGTGRRSLAALQPDCPRTPAMPQPSSGGCHSSMLLEKNWCRLGDSNT